MFVSDPQSNPRNDIQHWDGIPWHKAKKHRFWQRHRVQTTGYPDGGLVQIQRCSCGATRIPFYNRRWDRD